MPTSALFRADILDSVLFLSESGLEIGRIVTVFPYQPDPEILDSGFYLNMENIVPVQIIDECWYSLIVHNGKTGAMPGISVFNKSLYSTTGLDLDFDQLCRYLKWSYK